MRIKLYPPQAVIEMGSRSNQEDCIFPTEGKGTENDRLFILCDGMGGHERGEVASRAVCQGLSEYLRDLVKNDEVLTDQQLKDALEHAYELLDENDNGAFRKAGTTMTILCFHRGGCMAAHIGDSRIYHFRPSTRSVLYKSRDHSLVFELYQAGEISYQEMKSHPRKNQITRAMIAGSDNRQRMDVVHITNIQPGDYFMICSDGILERLDDEELMDLLTDGSSDEQKRQKLIELTASNADNHSAYLVHVADVQNDEDDEALPDDEQQVRFNAANIHPVPVVENDVKIVTDMEQDVEYSDSTQYQSLPQPKQESRFSGHKLWEVVLLISVLVVFIIWLITLIIK